MSQVKKKRNTLLRLLGVLANMAGIMAGPSGQFSHPLGMGGRVSKVVADHDDLLTH